MGELWPYSYIVACEFLNLSMVSFSPPPDDRTTPSSVESESAIISSIFIDGIQSLSLCLSNKIDHKFFHSPANRIIFSILVEMARDNKPLALDVVAEELRKRQELQLIGGYNYLVTVSSVMPTTAQLQYFIGRLRDTYIQRELIKSSLQVIDLAYEEKAEIEKYTTEVSRVLSIRYSLDHSKSIQEATLDTIGQLRRFRDGTATDDDIGYEFPWAKITKDFGEAQKGQLIVLAARPGGGKSSQLRQVFDHFASRYGDVMIFSREMMASELPQLFVQSRVGLSWRALKKGELHPKEVDEFEIGLQAFHEQKTIHIFDRERTLSQVIARATAFAQLHDVKAIGIDYLQRYDPEPVKGENRDQAIGRMTSAFKDLAIDLKLPLFLLCQVNRSSEKEDRPMIMSDLRESGNIEQDADRIIFLEVPKIDPLTNCPQNAEDEGTTQLYVTARQAKGRGDGRHSCGLYFNLPTTTFRSAVQERRASAPLTRDSSSSNLVHFPSH